MKTQLILIALLVLVILVAAASPQGFQTQPFPSTNWVSAGMSGDSGAVTATLPGVPGQFHFITTLRTVQVCKGAVPGEVITATTTNIPGSPDFILGTKCDPYETHVGLDYVFQNPVKAAAAGTDTTITLPSTGADSYGHISVSYFTAP